MAQLSANYIAESIEKLRGEGLTDEQRAEIEQWRNGRDLAALVNLPGWQVVLATIRSYAENAIAQALRVAPGDNDRVIAAHAVMYSLNDLYTKFLQDIQSAIDFGSKVPEIVKVGLKGASQVPPESL